MLYRDVNFSLYAKDSVLLRLDHGVACLMLMLTPVIGELGATCCSCLHETLDAKEKRSAKNVTQEWAHTYSDVTAFVELPRTTEPGWTKHFLHPTWLCHALHRLHIIFRDKPNEYSEE